MWLVTCGLRDVFSLTDGCALIGIRFPNLLYLIGARVEWINGINAVRSVMCCGM